MSDDTSETGARAWTFDELVQDGVSIIPAYSPQWTNHNPSDPGITLVELLAYITEILAYRALRITPDAKFHFLRLLQGGPTAASDRLIGGPTTDVDQAIRECVQTLSHGQCAVTPADFERLALDAAATRPGGGINVRATCVPGIDLRHAIDGHNQAMNAPADFSVALALERDLPRGAVEDYCRHIQESSGAAVPSDHPCARRCGSPPACLRRLRYRTGTGGRAIRRHRCSRRGIAAPIRCTAS